MRALVTVALVALVASLAPVGTAIVTWDDHTAASGIDFRTAGEVHPDGDGNWPAAPEIFGGGACFDDLDGDGYPDLFLANARFNPQNPAVGAWADVVDPRDALYRNEGDGTFEDVLDASGIDGRSFAYACSLADYDGDGDLDIYVAGWDGNRLYRNDGDMQFVDVTTIAGVGMVGACGAYACQSTSSAWADYDEDGDLDLYVGNYVDTHLSDSGRGPNNHVAQLNFLHVNNGDGTFTEAAAAAGIEGEATDHDGSKTLGVVWSDMDGDGDLDLYVANDEEPNDYYINNGDGTFTENGVAAGIDDHRAGMGLTIGDYDNDCLPDLFFTHYAGEENGFYRNLGDGTWEDRSGEDDLTNSRIYVGWGTHFVDIDLDMDVDIVLTNGHTDWTVDLVGTGTSYAEPAQVFRNDAEPAPTGPGDRLWVDVSDASGEIFAGERVGRGMAFADYDLDGDTDFIIVPNANQTAEFGRASGADFDWLRIELRQPGGNRFAVGAHVQVESDGVTQCREVQAGSSYLSQNEAALTFGLADTGKADKVTITWPGGQTTVLEDVLANQAIRVDRATGSFVTDTLSPWTALVGNTPGNDGWWADDVTVTLATEDRAVGVATGVASVDHRPPGGSWAPYAGQSYTFTAEGVHVIEVTSTDAIGNREPVRGLRVGIDRTAPEPTATVEGELGDNGWWLGPVNVTLDALDALSGAGVIEYALDGGPWTTYAGPVPVTGDGEHELVVRAADLAGNVAAPWTFDVAIDTTPPTVAIAEPGAGAAYVHQERHVLPADAPVRVVIHGDGTFLVVVEAADGNSGVAVTELALNGAMVADADGAGVTYAWDPAETGSGLHTFQAAARDEAGHRTPLTVAVLTFTGAAGPLAFPGLALLVGAISSSRSRRAR